MVMGCSKHSKTLISTLFISSSNTELKTRESLALLLRISFQILLWVLSDEIFLFAKACQSLTKSHFSCSFLFFIVCLASHFSQKYTVVYDHSHHHLSKLWMMGSKALQSCDWVRRVEWNNFLDSANLSLKRFFMTSFLKNSEETTETVL
jgi:hypothetical protein